MNGRRAAAALCIRAPELPSPPPLSSVHPLSCSLSPCVFAPYPPPPACLLATIACVCAGAHECHPTAFPLSSPPSFFYTYKSQQHMQANRASPVNQPRLRVPRASHRSHTAKTCVRQNKTNRSRESGVVAPRAQRLRLFASSSGFLLESSTAPLAPPERTIPSLLRGFLLLSHSPPSVSLSRLCLRFSWCATHSRLLSQGARGERVTHIHISGLYCSKPDSEPTASFAMIAAAPPAISSSTGLPPGTSSTAAPLPPPRPPPLPSPPRPP